MSHIVDCRNDGRRIILPILILAPTPSTDLTGVEALALVDTGSTTTGITSGLAAKLGLPPRGKRPIGSIRGEEQVERYIFRVGVELEREGPAFPFIFEDVEGFELREGLAFNALIGMDILRQCDFELLRDRSARLILP